MPSCSSSRSPAARCCSRTNCAPCHGLGGAGPRVYPTLADDDWLWGGTLEQIDYTIHHGIRNGVDPDARDNQMPAFGADGILTRPQIEDVAQHVLSLTGRATDQAAAGRGAELFAENCAACHGDAGQGNKEVGAPALNDAIWLYGGSLQQIEAQVTRPRHGVMPTWQGRLERQRDQDADHLRPRPGRGAVGAAGR